MAENNSKKGLDDYLRDRRKKKKVHSTKHLILHPGEDISAPQVSHDISIYEEKKKEIGFPGRRQLNKIQRKALIEAAKEDYENRMILLKEKLQASTQAGRARIQQDLEHELEIIEREHLIRLEELDLVAMDERNDLRDKLARLTTRVFDKINSSDYSDELKTELIEELIKDKEVIMNKLSQNLDPD